LLVALGALALMYLTQLIHGTAHRLAFRSRARWLWPGGPDDSRQARFVFATLILIASCAALPALTANLDLSGAMLSLVLLQAFAFGASKALLVEERRCPIRRRLRPEVRAAVAAIVAGLAGLVLLQVGRSVAERTSPWPFRPCRPRSPEVTSSC